MKQVSEKQLSLLRKLSHEQELKLEDLCFYFTCGRTSCSGKLTLHEAATIIDFLITRIKRKP